MTATGADTVPVAIDRWALESGANIAMVHAQEKLAARRAEQAERYRSFIGAGAIALG